MKIQVVVGSQAPKNQLLQPFLQCENPLTDNFVADIVVLRCFGKLRISAKHFFATYSSGSTLSGAKQNHSYVGFWLHDTMSSILAFAILFILVASTLMCFCFGCILERSHRRKVHVGPSSVTETDAIPNIDTLDVGIEDEEIAL